MSLRLYWQLKQPLKAHIPFLAPVVPKEQSNVLTPGWMIIILLVGLTIIFPFLMFLLGFILVMGYLMMPVTNTFRILNWITQSSSDLARMRDQKLYDLLALTPYGGLGVAWFTQRGVLSEQNRLPKADIQVQSWAGCSLIIAIITIGTYLLFRTRPVDDSLIQIVGSVFTAIILYLCDFAQSTALGCMIALLAPTYIHRGFEARVFTGGIFLLLQVSAYLLLLVTIIVLFRGYSASQEAFQPAGYVLRLSLIILMFYTFREIIIRLLHRLLLYRLNATSDEWDTLLRGFL